MIPESNHKWQDNVIINFKKSDIMRNDTNEKYLKGYKRIMSGKTEMQKEKKKTEEVSNFWENIKHFNVYAMEILETILRGGEEK